MNEYILTSLRTKWGCDNEILKAKYGVNLLALREGYLYDLFKNGMIQIEESCITLTNKGKLLADKIASDLFVFDELS
jgi:oxygen-independent coproporphyrinogen-3 oxidase